MASSRAGSFSDDEIRLSDTREVNRMHFKSGTRLLSLKSGERELDYCSSSCDIISSVSTISFFLFNDTTLKTRLVPFGGAGCSSSLGKPKLQAKLHGRVPSASYVRHIRV